MLNAVDTGRPIRLTAIFTMFDRLHFIRHLYRRRSALAQGSDLEGDGNGKRENAEMESRKEAAFVRFLPCLRVF